ncbi:hypothetical protein [Arthrobacter sp. efr-133-R2A-120]|uniref:helix-turn-helix domain-containing protein n=1 Tax=Arthrobacter sp. efr-133-R2A-120 TaxID=3040277 RepID=UPI00254A0BAF|nr:hypothetical protein [Arthrobacter sp. efr-133-R2A-120]
MKSGSSSAVAFGTVLQAVRKRSSRNQSEVAAFFSPKLSVAAVSMAEGGNRPPKTEAMVRGYADALELDADALLVLWWALQGMVEEEDPGNERPIQQWWHQLEASPQLQIDHTQAEEWAEDESGRNDEKYVPSLEAFVLADRICKILRNLLGDTWQIDYKVHLGLSDPVDGWPAVLKIELRSVPEEGDLGRGQELIGSFACPEPVTRPVTADATQRPNAETISPDVAWILSSVEAMPVRERAAVAGFIHGLREGATLFSGPPQPPHPAR